MLELSTATHLPTRLSLFAMDVVARRHNLHLILTWNQEETRTTGALQSTLPVVAHLMGLRYPCKAPVWTWETPPSSQLALLSQNNTYNPVASACPSLSACFSPWGPSTPALSIHKALSRWKPFRNHGLSVVVAPLLSKPCLLCFPWWMLLTSPWLIVFEFDC